MTRRPSPRPPRAHRPTCSRRFLPLAPGQVQGRNAACGFWSTRLMETPELLLAVDTWEKRHWEWEQRRQAEVSRPSRPRAWLAQRMPCIPDASPASAAPTPASQTLARQRQEEGSMHCTGKMRRGGGLLPITALKYRKANGLSHVAMDTRAQQESLRFLPSEGWLRGGPTPHQGELATTLFCVFLMTLGS